MRDILAPPRRGEAWVYKKNIGDSESHPSHVFGYFGIPLMENERADQAPLGSQFHASIAFGHTTPLTGIILVPTLVVVLHPPTINLHILPITVPLMPFLCLSLIHI